MIIVAPQPGDVITLRKIGSDDNKRAVKCKIQKINSDNKEYVVEHIGIGSAFGSDDIDGQEERLPFSKLTKIVQKAGDVRITKDSSLVE